MFNELAIKKSRVRNFFVTNTNEGINESFSAITKIIILYYLRFYPTFTTNIFVFLLNFGFWKIHLSCRAVRMWRSMRRVVWLGLDPSALAPWPQCSKPRLSRVWNNSRDLSFCSISVLATRYVRMKCWITRIQWSNTIDFEPVSWRMLLGNLWPKDLTL